MATMPRLPHLTARREHPHAARRAARPDARLSARATARRPMTPAPKDRAVQFGVWLLADQPADITARRARLAETVGLDLLGITDGQMIWRDLWISLAAAALGTKRIRLGPWVTNPVTRHPTVTASALCTLDELAGGRAFLGIGAGDD